MIYLGNINGRLRNFYRSHKSHGNRRVDHKLRHHNKSKHSKNYVERRGKVNIGYLISERPESAEQASATW